MNSTAAIDTACRRPFHRPMHALCLILAAVPAPVSAAPPVPASAAPPAPVSAPPPAPDTPVALHIAAEFPTGKWPEDVLIEGDDAWVADSGDRRVSRIRLTSGETTDFAVGRLPTHLARLPDGAHVALVQTTQIVSRIDAGGRKASTLAKLPDCPQAMAVEGDAIYVLLWERCSSVGGTVLRLDAKSPGKRPLRSKPVGRNPFGLAVSGGRLFVAHGDGKIDVLDAGTLKPALADIEWVDVGASGQVEASAGGVFFDGPQTLGRLDPATGLRTHSVSLGKRIERLALHKDAVYAALEGGEIRVFAQADLALRRTYTLAVGPLQVRGMDFWGEDLVTISFADEDALDDAAGKPPGRLLVLRAY